MHVPSLTPGKEGKRSMSTDFNAKIRGLCALLQTQRAANLPRLRTLENHLRHTPRTTVALIGFRICQSFIIAGVLGMLSTFEITLQEKNGDLQKQLSYLSLCCQPADIQTRQ